LAALVLLLVAGCATRTVPPPRTKPGTKGTKEYTVLGKTYRPLTTAQGYEEVGLASWYGPNFHGRRTSNGEIYNMEAMTAAHKLLPLNTWVKVTNLKNNREVVVRVNDRGPFVDGRIIDLSKAGARKLGILGPGTAKVRVVALGFRKPGTGGPGKEPQYQAPPSYQAGVFTVQVGAFANESNAYRLAATLRVKWGKVAVIRYDRGDMVFHRVRVGKLDSLDQAKDLQVKLRQAGLDHAFAVAW
jgi:rare lipoprotein A